MKPGDILFRATAYLKHCLKAGNAHGLHSPFVYSLYTECISQKGKIPPVLKALRSRLENDHSIISFDDYGAGGRKHSSYKSSVSRIARRAAKAEKYAQLLSRLCSYFKAEQFLELGTSLGLTTTTIALQNPSVKILTIEGAREVQNIAQNNFSQLGLKNIDSRPGNFDQVLPDVLKEMGKAEIVFIDGNHRKEPTLRYFNTLLPYTNSDSLLIFDDIHWSREMNEAWEEIKADPEVTLTVDLYALGLVFFKSGRAEKEHFVLRS